MICVAINDVDAIHTLQINWYKRNELVTSDGEHVILYNETDKASRHVTSMLLLDPVNRTDEGEYTCQAFNHPASFSELRTNLTVHCKIVTITHNCFK